jgi:hypothetical protein
MEIFIDRNNRKIILDGWIEQTYDEFFGEAAATMGIDPAEFVKFAETDTYFAVHGELGAVKKRFDKWKRWGRIAR